MLVNIVIDRVILLTSIFHFLRNPISKFNYSISNS